MQLIRLTFGCKRPNAKREGHPFFNLILDEEKRRFELLRKAYVSARYNPKFEITAEELKWLAERVMHLQNLTEQLCKEKIESFSE